jgi:hypothetical protein
MRSFSILLHPIFLSPLFPPNVSPRSPQNNDLHVSKLLSMPVSILEIVGEQLEKIIFSVTLFTNLSASLLHTSINKPACSHLH